MLGVKWLMEKEKQFANPGTERKLEITTHQNNLMPLLFDLPVMPKNKNLFNIFAATQR